MSETISLNDTIAEVLARRPGAAHLFFDRRMHCVGCAIAPFETVAEACAIYGVSAEDLIAEIVKEDSTEYEG